MAMLLQEESRKEYHSRINRALDFINENLNEDISLNSMAKAACFSPFHFHRIFFALISETPNDYVRRLRLEMAANKLANNPHLTITDIAFACGFSSLSVFARSFSSYFGISAKKWRYSNNGKFKSTTNLKAAKKTPHDRSIISAKNRGENIEIKILPDFHIAYVRCLTGYTQGVGKTWSKLFKWAGPRDLIKPDTTMMGIPLDNPDITPQGKCRYYACITVPEGFKSEGEVSLLDIESTRYAVYHFRGREEQINASYHYLYSWLPESGWEPQDKPALEIYTARPQKGVLRYDICVPIKPL